MKFIKAVFFILFMFFVLLFLFQNAAPLTNISQFGMKVGANEVIFPALPLYVIILSCLAIGGLLATIYFLGDRISMGRKVREAQLQAAAAEKRLAEAQALVVAPYGTAVEPTTTTVVEAPTATTVVTETVTTTSETSSH